MKALFIAWVILVGGVGVACGGSVTNAGPRCAADGGGASTNATAVSASAARRAPTNAVPQKSSGPRYAEMDEILPMCDEERRYYRIQRRNRTGKDLLMIPDRQERPAREPKIPDDVGVIIE